MSSGPRTSPTVLQAILAIMLGVCIGLLITQSFRLGRKPHYHAVARSQSESPISAMPQIKVMPTLEQRMNILLMGVDSNGRNTQRWLNTRSDTMILVSCDPEAHKVNMISIPRDSRVQLSGNHGLDKINAAHAIGGPDLAVATVKEALGVPVDHYVVIDAQGLKKVFQVLGPIPVLVEKRMRYNDWAGGLHVALEPGMHELTPEQAEQYVRFRHDPRGDIGRIERQQWFLRQLGNKLKEPQTFLKLPDLFKIANDYVVTDLSPEDMTRLAVFGKDLKPNQVQSATLPGQAVTIKGGSYWSPDPAADAVLFSRMLGIAPPLVAQTEVSSSWPNSAMAATDSDSSDSKPVSVTIKYPKGCEPTARGYETALNNSGFKVKYVIRGDTSDCQHEQILQNSFRADDVLTQRLRQGCPSVEQWPVVVALDNRAATDFTVVLSPDTQPLAVPVEVAPEASTEIPAPAPVSAPAAPRRRHHHHHAVQ